MKIQIDDINRIHLIDSFEPYGALIFDLNNEEIVVYQDAENQEVRTKFESIDESAQFEVSELIDGLKEVVELLESRAWMNQKVSGL